MVDKVIDSINHKHMDDADIHDASEFDQGLFQHQAGGNYLHLMREVLLTYRLLLRRLADETGVSGAQFELLRQMALSGGRSTTSALARELGVDPAAVTRLVAALERLGLVTREEDERDGRRRPVVLTPAGHDFMVRLHARLHEREDALAASLDPASVEVVMGVLQTIRSVLDPGAARRRA
jgi:DNA-binding MarR family transcriptional regulator